MGRRSSLHPRRGPVLGRASLAGLLSVAACAAACAAPGAAGSERAAPPAEGADLVLRGGRVVTLDPRRPEAEALAVAGGRIAAVGRDAEIAAWIGRSTEVIELDGRLAVPGFIEGHGHFLELGRSLEILDLRDARDWDGIVARVAEAARAAEPGAWILGRGWHQEKWEHAPEPAVEGFPTHASLSAVTPAHPVALEHASGHATFFNARAMELAGVGASTPDPEGGEILRLADGAPSGLFRETAAALVERAHDAWLGSLGPEEQEARVRRSLLRADRECGTKGITSFQDAGTDLETLRIVRDMVERGELRTRLWVMVRDTNERLRSGLGEARVVGLADHRLTVRAVKRSLDGALGSRGAWLLEPYADLPTSTGLNTASLASVEETARIALENDCQLCVHAIGDRANRELLDLYERVLSEHGLLGGDHRWRIEHAQHLAPADVPRFAAAGIIASMQTVHCTSDGPWVPARLGEERAREGAYLWRALLDSGALVANGTDAPVEDLDPIANFHAAVTRRMPDGTPFHPAQRMTRTEALEAATLSCAYAAFEEHLKGSLRPGKLADVVVLSKDVLRVPEDEIREASVDLTLVGGVPASAGR